MYAPTNTRDNSYRRARTVIEVSSRLRGCGGELSVHNANRMHCPAGNFSSGRQPPMVFELPLEKSGNYSTIKYRRALTNLVTPVRLLHCSRNRRAFKVTTGRTMFVEIGDGRSAWALRWKDLIAAHVSDLGGPELLSEAQISICRRASAMECTLELYEARMSAGEAIDLDLYGRLAGRLCRMFELIGIKRLAKPIDPLTDLAEASKGRTKAIDDDEPNDEDEPAAIEQGLDNSERGEA